MWWDIFVLVKCMMWEMPVKTPLCTNIDKKKPCILLGYRWNFMMNFTGWWKCMVMSLMLLSNNHRVRHICKLMQQFLWQLAVELKMQWKHIHGTLDFLFGTWKRKQKSICCVHCHHKQISICKRSVWWKRHWWKNVHIFIIYIFEYSHKSVANWMET